MLRLPQTLMHPQAQACLLELQAGVATSASPIVVDASALTAFDSCALAVLLELRRSTALAGKDLRLKGLPEQLKVLASVYGVQDLISDAPSQIGLAP
ncbi:MAG: STAS domain-containing protein [Comamonadaceae bacterium]